jgi:HD superfamily phosphohydrolase
MASSPARQADKIIVDSIHGDIHLNEVERRVIDTASFQRLRHLKQLGMAQVTYPNATHTRFAHSIGVLGIMAKITDIARDALGLDEEKVEDIRLAGLVHDIGHYPYSHLMERVDKVQLTEEIVAGGTTVQSSQAPYPDHEQVGEWIVTNQPDLIEALGGMDRAARVASLFTRNASADPQLSKLIHSSLDMDRLDYLIRDSRAAGVPHGEIDLNYLINNFRLSPSGVLGVREKAITAVDHFLTARLYMHRSVYYHKTTFGFEEACRQLLRRLRDAKLFDLPTDAETIEGLVKGERLSEFTDSYVDGLIDKASRYDQDLVIQTLANSIRRRRPPKLLREVQVFEPNASRHHAGEAFRRECKHRLQGLANTKKIPLGLFLLADTKPLRLEERGAFLTGDEVKKLKPDERQEIIRVFVDGQVEPVSVVDVRHSLTHLCSSHFYQTTRLYLVTDNDTTPDLIQDLRAEVRNWCDS